MLGPIVYCIYTRLIGDIIARHKMQYHCYADDRQIDLTVERDECTVSGLCKMETCVAEVAVWMERNQLKLNKEKSEAIIFLTAKQRVHFPAEISLTIAGH